MTHLTPVKKTFRQVVWLLLLLLLLNFLLDPITHMVVCLALSLSIEKKSFEKLPTVEQSYQSRARRKGVVAVVAIAIHSL